MNDAQQSLIATMKAGVRYTEYHVQMHQRIAGLLNKYGIVKGVSEDGKCWVNYTILPHGLGHALGLQVHDAAGLCKMIRNSLAAPAMYPFLRCTRIEPGMVLTLNLDLLHRFFIRALKRRKIQYSFQLEAY